MIKKVIEMFPDLVFKTPQIAWHCQWQVVITDKKKWSIIFKVHYKHGEKKLNYLSVIILAIENIIKLLTYEKT